MLLSCKGSGEALPIAVSDSVESLGAGPVFDPETSLRVETTRRVVLSRGNQWVNGIPGFGVNVFAALAGEYRLSPRAAGGTGSGGAGDFSLYLTTESLFFTGEWQPWPQNDRILWRDDEGAFLAAMAIEDSRGGPSWIAVFEFSHGLEEAGLDANAFNQVIRIWTSKFIYFLSLSKIIEDVSLPAVVEL